MTHAAQDVTDKGSQEVTPENNNSGAAVSADPVAAGDGNKTEFFKPHHSER